MGAGEAARTGNSASEAKRHEGGVQTQEAPEAWNLGSARAHDSGIEDASEAHARRSIQTIRSDGRAGEVEMLKVDRDLKDMLDRYLARLWNEEVRLAVEQRRAASDKLKDDMKEHAKANAAGRLTDKAAATWRLIVKAKRRVNADYNRIGKSRFCRSKNAPFADSQSVLEFEKAVLS